MVVFGSLSVNCFWCVVWCLMDVKWMELMDGVVKFVILIDGLIFFLLVYCVLVWFFIKLFVFYNLGVGIVCF